MCGIAGMVGGAPSDTAVGEMLKMLQHRGPDETVLERSPQHTFGSCRLSINGLADGSQPLRGPGISMIYNGEVYNSRELRLLVRREDHKILAEVDGAPVPYLFRQLGLSALGMIDGPYAIALWDWEERSLTLARDPLGEKPLYYRRLSSGGIAFASEESPLRSLPGETSSLNIQALWDVPTFLWTPEPVTAIHEIHALPAGHALIHRDGSTEISPIPRAPRSWQEPLTDADATERTRNLVYEAVRTRAMSEVPIGTFLSGGLDSSIVTSILREQSHNLERAFSVRLSAFDDFQHGYVDESLQAQEFAASLNLPLTLVEITHDRARSMLPDFVRAADSPNAVSSGLGIMAVAEEARRSDIKVLVSGDCADELFGGYSWYPFLGLPYQVPFEAGLEPSFQAHGLPLSHRLDALSRVAGPQRSLSWHYYASESAKKSVFAKWVSEASEPSIRLASRWLPNQIWEPIDFINNDRDFYLSQEMLRKADKFAMYKSVEVRVPFAAPWLLDFSRTLTHQQLVRDDVLKWALRRAFRKDLAPAILNRRKHGFNFPIAEWLRGPWNDLVVDTFSAQSPLSDVGLIHEGSLQAALRLLYDSEQDQGHAVFSWVVMSMWLEWVGSSVDC